MTENTEKQAVTGEAAREARELLVEHLRALHKLLLSQGMETNCCLPAADFIERALSTRREDALRDALEQTQAVIAIMFGNGPNADIPETVDTPLGVSIKLGEIMRDARAAIAALPRVDGEVERLQPLLAALTEYLEQHDEDDWCQRIKYGKCSTLKCLRPQGKPPYDVEKATCPRWELEQARAALTENT